MREPRSRARRALLCLALLFVALVVAACAGVSAPVATPAPQAGAPAPAQQTVQPNATGAAAAPGTSAELPVGVDAEGNFYRGSLNAPVKLVEWSDFQ